MGNLPIVTAENISKIFKVRDKIVIIDSKFEERKGDSKK